MTPDLLEAAPAPTPASVESASPAAAPRRRVRPLLAGGLLAGGALASVLVLGRIDGGPGDGGRGDQAGYAPTVTLPAVGPGSPTAFVTGATAVGAAAATPTDAVVRFLDAEIAGDLAASFAQLSAEDRAAYGSSEDWAATHDELPTYVTYRLVSAGGASGDGAPTDDPSLDDEVLVEVTLVPAIDEVVGVVAGAGTATFVTTEEDGGYRIVLADSRLEARYPSDATAAATALAWIAARQGCDTSGVAEFGGTLLGELGLPERLCGVAGVPIAAGAEALDALDDPTAVLSAFGGDAIDWARVVEVSGLDGVAAIRVVLAPLGDGWVVVGAVGAT